MATPLPLSSGEAGAPSPDENDDQLAEVLTDFNRRFKHAKKHWDEWRNEARQLYDLVAGRQWDGADEAKLKEALRPMVTFNVSGKYMDAMVGLQINNRQETRFYPREVGDAKLNELLTGAVSWGRDLCDQADEETDAFYDCALTGIGWMEGYLDKDLETTGVPAGQRVDNMEMFPDPAARKRNLEDARYVIRIKFIDHEEYETLFGEEYGTGDDAFRVDDQDEGLELIQQPQDYDSELASETNSPRQDKCPVADYQYWKREKRYELRHPQLGTKLLTEEQMKQYEPFLTAAKANGQRFDVQPVMKKVYYRAFISKGEIGQHGLSPYQDGFTYHAITGKRDRNKNTWYGIGRSLLDPQRWLNKFFSTILYVMMTNAKGGIMAEENSFKDARKAESEWANPDSITWLKEGALQKGKIEPKPPGVYPQGLDRLMEFTLNSLPQTTGLNVELMGLADRVQAGVVEAQRKQSAMAIIAWAFDAMRRYYRSMGRMQARYVIDYMPEGTLVMINGGDTQQYVPLVKSQGSITFDVIVDEAPTSVNMKERVWAVLETLIPQLLQAGMAIPPAVLEYSPLPTELVTKWKEALQPDPKVTQHKEATAQAQLADLVNDGKLKDSTATLNNAKAMQIQAELMKPSEDPTAAAKAEAQVKLFISQIEANVESRIAEFKSNREAETKLMMAQMDIHSKERIAQMNAVVDAKLEAMRIHSENQRAAQDSQRAQEDGKRQESMHKATTDSHGALAEAVKGMGEAIKTLSRPKKITRNKAGEIDSIG